MFYLKFFEVKKNVILNLLICKLGQGKQEVNLFLHVIVS